ncbi:hypothetical protein KIN20_036691 [Parelaphostrongylus tenuis]|uniref:Uncharacterized protein n=1 Tax=Parelaphostrongylus tenuis TaxID=148309 RepID=A0AAD5WLV3_PARTN|nr:hypothetical protein KIN20_036691 [Parelaphostrongylus tenuis]
MCTAKWMKLVFRNNEQTETYSTSWSSLASIDVMKCLKQQQRVFSGTNSGLSANSRPRCYLRGGEFREQISFLCRTYFA